MALYQRIQVVDARQYDGPGNLTVVSDALGEQRANKGDWLLGSERGKVTVKTAADWASEDWAPCETPITDELTAANAKVDQLQAALKAEEDEHSQTIAQLSTEQEANNHLRTQVGDTLALQNTILQLTTDLKAFQAAQATAQAEPGQ